MDRSHGIIIPLSCVWEMTVYLVTKRILECMNGVMALEWMIWNLERKWKKVREKEIACTFRFLICSVCICGDNVFISSKVY